MTLFTPEFALLNIGGFEFLFLLMFSCVGIVGTILLIWMLIDCATKESDQGNNKIVWILIIALTHLIGALIYLLVRRPQRIAELGR
jgi:hypothetical protein